MGRVSTKTDKTEYQICREKSGQTREQAASEMFTTVSRIENIEYERTNPTPEDIVAMAECYKDASLCNYYCANKCAIGQQSVPEITLTSLPQITLGLLSSLNTIEKSKNRLIEIAEDGKITTEEIKDFEGIEETLDKISLSIDALKLWIEQSKLNEKNDK